tara:strand:- start:53 stop:241 length:189 start_codon:yes stop_codon:yes gene_type:complete
MKKHNSSGGLKREMISITGDLTGHKIFVKSVIKGEEIFVIGEIPMTVSESTRDYKVTRKPDY